MALAQVLDFPVNDDGDPVIPVDDVETPDQPLSFDEDDPNLVETFSLSEEGRKALRSIGDRVYKDFEADWESTRARREKDAENLKLFAGELPPKDWPYKNAANAHVPIVLENITRLSFRVESEICGDWSNIFGVTPVGPDDQDVAEILSQHGNWQIREKLTDFPRQLSRGCLGFFMLGDITCHTYWDPIRKRNRNEMLTCEDFVTPYAHSTSEPDYSDLPHYTKVFRLYRHELQAMDGTWHGVQEVLSGRKPDFDDDPEETIREAMAEVYGEEKPNNSDTAPYKMLWYEGWLQLPTQDKERFCKVILDYQSKKVLLLTILEETNWQERSRFERQSAEIEQYRNQMLALVDAQERLIQSQAQLEQAMGMGADPMMLAGAQQEIAQLQMATQQQPIPPEWLLDPEDLAAEPEPPRKDPVYMFSHGCCIDPLVGNLGLSFGAILADFNRAADTMLSQYIDAATLANAAPLITSSMVEFDSPFEAAPGKINKITGVASDIKGHVLPLQMPPANEQLAATVDRMVSYGQSSVQAPSVLSGEPGKSGETYRGISARIEQATKQISVAARKFGNFLKQILVNNARLNAQFLPDDEMFSVLNHKTGKYDLLKAGKHLYERDYRVEIRSDLRFAPQAQRIAEADELIQLPGALPPMQQNFSFLWQALRKGLLARGREDMLPYLGPDPGVTQTPLGLPPQAFPPGSPFGPPPMPPGMMPPGMAPPGAPPGSPPEGGPPPEGPPA